VTLRWAAQNDVLTLDPHSQNHATTHSMMQHTYEGLTRYSKDYKIEPSLATGWKQLSDTHWRFTLRKEVKFHDGSPFTADDVVFSFEHQAAAGHQPGPVTGVKEVRDRRLPVDFLLEGPTPILLRNIVDFASWRWRREKNNSQRRDADYAKKRRPTPRNTNGTGPYILSWGPTAHVFAQNKGWWGKPEATSATWSADQVRPDAHLGAALWRGRLGDRPLRPRTSSGCARRRTSIRDGIEVRTIFIGLDQHSTGSEVLSVKGRTRSGRARAAGSTRRDRGRRSEGHHGRPGRCLQIMIAPGVHGYTRSRPVRNTTSPARRSCSPGQATDGFEFTLDCPNNRYTSTTKVPGAGAMWAKTGLRAKLNTLPFANFIPKILNFDTSAYILGWAWRPRRL
jgi:peptide/nickel transport system substrate-binding protein